jgi:hypothetical protein
MTNYQYEGFSKQDLIDRKLALMSEWDDNWKEAKVLEMEIQYINTLLEVDKLATEGLREMGKDQLARNKLLEEK